MPFKFLSALLLSLTLLGCSLAPEDKLPPVPMTDAYRHAADSHETLPGTWKQGEPAAHLPRGAWWLAFQDEALNALQAEAATTNPSLQAMASRVKQARLTARIATSALFPDVDATGSFTRQKPAAITRGFAPGVPLNLENIWRGGLGLSYEIDVLGRLSDTRRAAKADAAGIAAQFQSLKLALQADVAQLYFSLRALEAEKAVLQRAIALRTESLQILRKRLAIGIMTELDLTQAIVDLETARRDMQRVAQAARETAHALAILLGRPPAAFTLPPGKLASKVPAEPAGLPAALLERRPDITAAQYALAAANARIGVARASFFPTVSLTTTGGYESAMLRDVLNWSSRTWSVAPMIAVPVFGGGRAIANHKRSKAAYEEAVALYRQSVLVAFRDVEDSLSRLRTLLEQDQSQKISDKAARRAAVLVGKRYKNGAVGYIEDLRARRNALDVERFGVQIQGARLQETVRLIRALGGTWNMPAKQRKEGCDPND